MVGNCYFQCIALLQPVHVPKENQPQYNHHYFLKNVGTLQNKFFLKIFTILLLLHFLTTKNCVIFLAHTIL